MLKPNDKEREYWKVKVINSPEDNPRNIRIRKIMKGNIILNTREEEWKDNEQEGDEDLVDEDKFLS